MNEFAIANVLLGKLNAMVRNIMIEMKIDDPVEAVRRINSREWVVIPNIKSILNVVAPRNDYLQGVAAGRRVIIPACDGSKIIPESDTFNWKHENFRKLRADERGVATPKVEVSVLEMVKDATFGQMLEIDVRNLSNVESAGIQRLRQMILTQHQIIEFCVNNCDCLRTDRDITFFLFESYKNFFVARVYFSDNSLSADVYPLEDPDEWLADYHPRMIIPKPVSFLAS